jgi:plasmid stabilization system protein ParE
MIYFMVSEEEVLVARILHASRDPFSADIKDI